MSRKKEPFNRNLEKTILVYSNLYSQFSPDLIRCLRTLRARLRCIARPASLYFARIVRALRDTTRTRVSEASCPNFEPRADARLTGLTMKKGTIFGTKLSTKIRGQRTANICNF